MKRYFVLLFHILIINISLSAQKYEPVTVRAGMRVIDYFPFSERYRYPEFITGRIYIKSGVYSEYKLNYDFLNGEMEYIRSRDTLAISNTKDIRYITVEQDTFYYDNGSYFELIAGSNIQVFLKQYIRLKETLKKDSYGTASSGSSTTSYGSLPVNGNFYSLTANEDMVFQRTLEYYLPASSGGFVPYTKKSVLQLFPDDEDAIKAYLKSNKINFSKSEDLIKLAVFLESL
jgi:hypothetical protein